MSTLTFIDESKSLIKVPKQYLKGKRHLTDTEISVLVDNLNSNEDVSWKNVWVDDDKFGFNPVLVKNSSFSGFVVLGRICNAKLKYHDLELRTGIFDSKLCNVVTGNDNAIHNTSIENYHIGDKIILSNIQELCCTNHSKFGNGILKQGETEETRITIAVGNENGGRAILPFQDMITADAYLWSRYRDDTLLMQRFKELTECDFSDKLDTFGIIENDCVIKNSTSIKDTKIGEAAYIKGAFKIKNTTILSSESEPTQIGEGVELVNGIVGYASRIFYQAVAVRFVIGRNCQLKYGARLLNSVLGDNSTVSCCELLNNLIFPFHEQHHNSSFLIASTVLGQSNVAAASTIGSNHNSRSPDGEIIAGRGFWPGLCSNFKHNSRFASFCLIAKGNYHYEMDIKYPFSLVAPGEKLSSPIVIIPAWLFVSNMFSVVRNKYKFTSRDKRITKIQNIETNPIAPDTIQEIIKACERIIELTALHLKKDRQSAKDYLHDAKAKDFVLYDADCMRKIGADIQKPKAAYKMYRKIAKYFAMQALLDFSEKNKTAAFDADTISLLKDVPLYTEWLNVGGQIIPEAKIAELFEQIKGNTINNWREVHAFYDEAQTHYTDFKARYAIYVLERLYSRKIDEFTSEIYDDIKKDVIVVSNEMYSSAVSSHEKDFSDKFRRLTYRNEEEMRAVLGTINDCDFLKTLKSDTEKFNEKVEKL